MKNLIAKISFKCFIELQTNYNLLRLKSFLHDFIVNLFKISLDC